MCTSHGLSHGGFSYTYVHWHHKPFHQQIASHRPPLWPLHTLHDRGEELWLEYHQKEESNFCRCRRWSLDLLSLPLSMLKMKPGRALTTGILSRFGLADILISMEESSGWLIISNIFCRQDHLMYTNSFVSPTGNWFPCVGQVCIKGNYFFSQDHLMYTNNFPLPSGCVGQVRCWGNWKIKTMDQNNQRQYQQQ